ncbi:uncharacterized protein EV422DRAFT_170250 [Fimicolochytrium jonesii]|uniref:uncharacterized protein n=1 Tax=Fimicolochytrium jonesii TaxID=1396493 RepID=UPI0022FEDA29|nr:uncharacterized protein EV422DRAFT_170250 [Fimicolochytrium jonesii]KAI8818513.1 hypothetical protein EV422DRAFT_170250 [Fimicolochytrium jonesii]
MAPKSTTSRSPERGRSTRRSRSRSRSPSRSSSRSSYTRSSYSRSRSRSVSRSLSRSLSRSRSRSRSLSRSKSRSRSRSPPASPPQKSVRPVETRTTKVVATGLTKNVNKEHLLEIFGHYGELKGVEFTEGLGPERGRAFIIFNELAPAQKACRYMDGANIDGLDITCSIVIDYSKPPPSPSAHVHPGRQALLSRPDPAPPASATRRRSVSKDRERTYARKGYTGRSPSPSRGNRRRSRSPLRRRPY